jgi:hypothetical protein
MKIPVDIGPGVGFGAYLRTEDKGTKGAGKGTRSMDRWRKRRGSKKKYFIKKKSSETARAEVKLERRKREGEERELTWG